MPSPEEPPFATYAPGDAETYRALARRHAASVTAVTVRRAGGALDGFTATAFLTVSMDPPIVLVSASNATSAAAMLRDADVFAVNLLAADQRRVAEGFARPHEERAEVFDALPWSAVDGGAPVLGGTVGAFSARVRQRVDAGDHTLVLGDVTAIHLGDAESPLVYFNRAYATLATP